MRKALPAIAIMLVLIAIIAGGSGCGGGGTSSNGGNGGNGGSFGLSPSSATVGSNGRVYMAAMQGGIPVDVSWSATTGVVTPTGTGTAYWQGASGATVTATKISGSGTDTCIISVDASKASVYGRLIDSAAFGGISGAIVDFKQGSSTVASATTIPTGHFSAAVPTGATRFHVRSNSISSAFYKQYTYNALRYTMLSSTCTAPLPGLALGAATPLVSNVVVAVASGPPPPPPNGCP